MIYKYNLKRHNVSYFNISKGVVNLKNGGYGEEYRGRKYRKYMQSQDF